MSEILSNIILEKTNINFTPSVTNVNITPDTTKLNFYLGGIGIPGGNLYTVQYNAGGVLDGMPNIAWTGTQLSLGSTSDITISGGTANYALITDGAGNLTWGDVENANYASYAGNVINASQPNITTIGTLTSLTVSGATNLGDVGNVEITGGMPGYGLITDGTGNLSWGNIQNSNYASYAGNIVNAAQPNITSVGNLTSLKVTGVSTLGNVGNVKITGGNNGQYLQTDGTGNLFWVSGGGSGNGVVGGSNTQVQFNDGGIFGGDAGFTFNKTTGNLNVSSNIIAGNLSITPIKSLPYGTEPVTIISLPTGTYNFDLINGSIRYATDIANANVTINFRGNSTVTANSIVANQHSIIGTYMMTNGNTAYGISSIQIDGVSQTIKWINGVSPVIANNAIMVYSFTCIKTANTPTYTVLASGTRYL